VGLEFGVLGPLQVAAGGALVRLGGPKQRAVLALLLLEAGELIPTERLVEQIWRGQPGGSARSVQVYVSELRRLLGDAGRIRGEGGGYRLVAADEEIDARRFEQLLAEGRNSLALGDPDAAARTLGEALGLWRGAALADLAYEEFAQTEISRLEELRVTALEERNAAELALGRHAGLVAELEALVRQEPLRERLRAQLMLALYRSGRQPDALEVYHDTRKALLELGLEPGSELRELEAAVLRQDSTLTVEPPELRARRRLPAPATPLVGRRREVDGVARLLRQDARLVTLTGPGGTGKTRLALQAAYELADSFPDGVVFIGLAALRDPALVLLEIAASLELESGNGPVEDALEGHLRERAMLLLIDNFEHVDAAAPMLGPLLGKAERVRLLVTSRHPLRLYGEHEFPVPPLAEDDSVGLFLARARAVRPETAANGAVRVLCARLDRLPLAIELAAARARELTPAEMLAMLPRRLELAAHGPRDAPERHQTLRSTIAWSYKLLSEGEQTLFARVSVFSGNWTGAAAAEVCDADDAELRSLVDKSLVHETDGRFSMLETIREYAHERLLAGGGGEEIGRRHARYFLELVRAGERVRRQPGETDWMDQLESERANLRIALAWWLEHDPAAAERFADGAFRFWASRAHFEEGELAFDRVLEAARLEPADRARVLSYASSFAFGRRDLAKADALAEESLELQRPLGDDVALARALVLLGTIRTEQGAHDESVSLLEEALSLARRSEFDQVIAFAVNHLGMALVSAGEYERFGPVGREAVELARKVGDRPGECGALTNIAYAALLADEVAAAATHFAETLSLALEIRDPLGIASAFEGFAGVAAARGNGERAARLLGAAETFVDARNLTLERLNRDARQRTELTLRDSLGEDEFRRQTSLGRALEEQEAVAEALEVAHAATTRP
jgi:predicted ATPase/DNA-binding SARP family transcriptional activator